MSADPTELLTPRGRELLARLDAEPAGPALAVGERLRREYPVGLVALAMAQRDLRAAARAKFTRAGEMLFTRAGYEQSSSELVSRYRAGRLRDAARIADLCCGIGGDLIALAGRDHPAPAADRNREVLAVDRDERHARLALYNAGVYGGGPRVRAAVADVRDIRLASLDAVFIDPARRSGPATSSAGTASRFRAGESEPPLDWCLALAGPVPAVCVKAAPGLPADLIPGGWEAEFIADGRDLKEAVLWSPALATAPVASPPDVPPGRRRATVLAASGADSLVACPGGEVPLTAPGEYLLDPSPAVTRAGLVADLARTLGAAKIDPQIAFLTLGHPVATPFARTLRVLHSAPWHEKQFARRLRELGIGAADIRRRGLAGDVDQIRKRLRLSGPNRAVIVITRVADRPWGLICAAPG